MPATLTNYLGTGSNPRLRLTLGDNQAKWKPFTIDYQQSGNVPIGWSTWNVTDEQGNYYGTITVTSNDIGLIYNGYVKGSKGYELEDIKLNNGALSAGKIIQPNNAGPFPNTPRAQPAIFAGTNTPIKFSAQGPNIIDNFGRKVQLKGIVRPSLEWNSQGEFLSPADIKKMAAWGSNVIRLDLNQDFWLRSHDASVKGSYKQIIDAIIYEATQNNMAVILDLHWLNSESKQAPMANLQSLTFWTEVATAYKDFGTVIFELFNEPYGIDKNTWLRGNGTSTVGYQQLYDAVHTAGATNLVIVNGLDWGYDLSFVNKDFCISGTNIIYGSHPYQEKGAPGYTGPGGSFANNFKNLLGQYPLIFTEFGDNNSAHYPSNYKAAYELSLNFANANGVHYTGFAWWVDLMNPAFPTLISDWNGTPVNGGILVHANIQQNPPTHFFQPPTALHQSARKIAIKLADIQLECPEHSVIYGILRQCLNVALNTNITPANLLTLLEEKRDQIRTKEEEMTQTTEATPSCFSLLPTFFSSKPKSLTTPITDRLDSLIQEQKHALDVTSSHTYKK